MTKKEYLDAVCKFCCGRNTCCVGTDQFHPCKTYVYCNECWDESAKRQRELDIDKACREFLRFLEARVNNPNYQLREEDFPAWITDFKSVLEEEQ